MQGFASSSRDVATSGGNTTMCGEHEGEIHIGDVHADSIGPVGVRGTVTVMKSDAERIGPPSVNLSARSTGATREQPTRFAPDRIDSVATSEVQHNITNIDALGHANKVGATVPTTGGVVDLAVDDVSDETRGGHVRPRCGCLQQRVMARCPIAEVFIPQSALPFVLCRSAQP